MKTSDAGNSLILLGVLLGPLGLGLTLITEEQTFGAFGYYYPITVHPYLFLGAIMLSVGMNWIIGGLILRSANKDIANDGIILSFLFGALGVIIWLIVSHPDNRIIDTPRNSAEMHSHCPNCNMAVPLSSGQYCPHCGRQQYIAKPTYTITEVGA